MDVIQSDSDSHLNRRRLLIGCGLALAGITQSMRPEPSLAEPATPATEPEPGKYFSINAVDLYVTELGPATGSPVVMLHGGMGSSENWAMVAPSMADAGFRVVMLDSRSQGRSGWSEKPITYELMASDVVGLLDALGIDRASVVGWSDGAIVGLELAMNSPERLTSLVAYAANYTPDGFLMPSSGPEFDAMIGELAAEYLRLSPQPERFAELLTQLGALYSVSPNFSESQLASITVPTLVLDGSNDTLIDPSQPIVISESIPNSQLEIIPEAGHFAPLEQADEFARIVLEFLDSVTEPTVAQ